VEVCPTHSIIETNFPPKKIKKPKETPVVKASVNQQNPSANA
jgi:hypothetical protein